MAQPLIFVGIDVSKTQLDVALRPTGRFVVPHDDDGIAQLLDRLQATAPTLIILEATGGIELPLTGALAAAGLPVVVVNPRQIRDFAKAVGPLAKTDALDAQVLAHFAEVGQPTPRPLPDVETQELAALVTRQLIEMLTAEKNRVASARVVIRKQLRAHITWLERAWITTTLLENLPELGTLTHKHIAAPVEWRRSIEIAARCKGANGLGWTRAGAGGPLYGRDCGHPLQSCHSWLLSALVCCRQSEKGGIGGLHAEVVDDRECDA